MKYWTIKLFLILFWGYGQPGKHNENMGSIFLQKFLSRVLNFFGDS